MVDSRPITTTSVEYRPCHAAKGYSRDEDAAFFPLERDFEYQPETCDSYDDRFIKLDNFQTNEYDIQTLSSVYKSLSESPGYNVTDESKKNTEYYFWIRPTLDWTCSAEDLDEALDILDSATQFVGYDTIPFELIIWIFIAIDILGNLVGCSLPSCETDYSKNYWFFKAYTSGIDTILALTCLLYAISHTRTFEIQRERVGRIQVLLGK